MLSIRQNLKVSLFHLIFLPATQYPDKQTDNEERRRRQQQQAVGNIPATIGNQRQNFETQRSEEHTSELQSRENLVCRLLLEQTKINKLIKTRLTILITNY